MYDIAKKWTLILFQFCEKENEQVDFDAEGNIFE
jgi:hypothetical protein